MAVPTITSLTPAYGPAAGSNLIKITGTNFLIHDPPAGGYVGGSPAESVRVKFNGIQANSVSVLSTTELLVLVPQFTGASLQHEYTPVAIHLQNIDATGIPIPLEEVEVLAAYTYKREPLRPPSLPVESAYKRITKELISAVQRQILLDTGLTTHTDYSPDGVQILEATLPSLSLMGPDVIPDAYGAENALVYETLVSGSAEWPPPVMQTLQFELRGLSDNSGEFLTLMGAARKFCRTNPYFNMIADIPVGRNMRLPLVVTVEPSRSGDVLNANLHEFVLSFELRRVPILFAPAVATVWPINEIELQSQAFNGILVEISSI